ncbi:alpha/beta hydrolase [Amycolatopsis echigonensis]
MSLADVRSWNPGVLDEICSDLQARVKVLVNEGEDYGKLLPVEGWSGPAADAAAAQHKTHMQGLDTYVAGASALSKAVGQAADAILGVQAAIKNADELARKYGYAITADGAITCAYGGNPPPEINPQDRAHARQQLADDLAQIMRTADDIDSDLASVLDRAAAGQFGTGNESTVAAAAADGLKDPGLTLPEPPANATPSQNAAWWATLSAAGKGILFRDRPGAIGSMDGLPAVDRDRANRAVLAQRHADLQRQRDAIQHRLDQIEGTDPRLMGEVDDLKQQRETLDGKLKGMDAIQQRLDHQGEGKSPAFLLKFDDAGQGRAIVAMGNPDTAANVATYVPGTGSELSKIEGDLGRSDLMEAAAEKAGSPSTSVITWQGYDAPPGLINAASTSYADNGKQALTGFEEGLRASHQGTPSNNTLLGHSYGTTLVGHAASSTHLPVDNIVLVASPGVGVDHAAQLNIPPDHVFSTTAEHDLINVTNFSRQLDGSGALLDPLGPSPTDPEFGGKTFQSAPGTEGSWWLDGNSSEAHSQYWDRGNQSLTSMGQIIAGKQPN